MINFDVAFSQDMSSEVLRLFASHDDRVFMLDVGEIMKFAVEEQFETEGRFFGGRGPGSFGYKWFDLAPATKMRRKKMNKWPGKILQVTSELASSIGSRVSGDSVIISTITEYAPYLHFGTDRMPPRPFFSTKLPEETINEIAQSYIKHWQ